MLTKNPWYGSHPSCAAK